MAYRKLNRVTNRRKNILVSLTQTLIKNESIITSEARAKEVRKFMDRLVTYGQKNTLGSRRRALAFLRNDSQAVTKVFNDLAPRFKDRKGGYTRIIKIKERIGDDSLQVKLELLK